MYELKKSLMSFRSQIVLNDLWQPVIENFRKSALKRKAEYCCFVAWSPIDLKRKAKYCCFVAWSDQRERWEPVDYHNKHQLHNDNWSFIIHHQSSSFFFLHSPLFKKKNWYLSIEVCQIVIKIFVTLSELLSKII